MENFLIGKIVSAVAYDGSTHNARIVDKVRRDGRDLWVFVKTDGSTFFSDNIEIIHTLEDAEYFWGEYFIKFFTS